MLILIITIICWNSRTYFQGCNCEHQITIWWSMQCLHQPLTCTSNNNASSGEQLHSWPIISFRLLKPLINSLDDFVPTFCINSLNVFTRCCGYILHGYETSSLNVRFYVGCHVFNIVLYFYSVKKIKSTKNIFMRFVSYLKLHVLC